MGLVSLQESQEYMEMEEFRRSLLLSSGGLQVLKHEEKPRNQRLTIKNGNDPVVTEEEKVVCVTGGVSFLGLAIVNRLLIRGYSVRIIVTNEEDIEKLREMEVSGEMWGIANNRVSAVVANFTDVLSLSDAFDGCHGVFHTADIVDPAGLSGYSKSMADIEVKTSENVMEACARTESVRNCVLTSSLLACIWRDGSSRRDHLSSLVNHHCWSDEPVCIRKKLWYALGKLRAEKAAWRTATEDRSMKLVTICPGLITGPGSNHRNPTTTIAYLKGAQEMFVNGLLATVDVYRLAEAHVSVLEAMNRTEAFGRYICFDRVIQREQEVEDLARRELGIQTNIIISGGNESNSTSSFRFRLSNLKLSRLLQRTQQCSHEC